MLLVICSEVLSFSNIQRNVGRINVNRIDRSIPSTISSNPIPITGLNSFTMMASRRDMGASQGEAKNIDRLSGAGRKTMYVTMMASRGGGQGSTKIDKKTDIDTKTKPTYREEIEKDWRLILHDDTVHTIQQVCEILGTCCPLCSGPRAYEVTLEVHMTGAGTVAVANKKIVDEYCKSLQQAGLSVSMAPDDDFEADDDME